MLFTRRAAASYLGLKLSGLRMAICRKRLHEESQGLTSLDELERYLLRYRRRKPNTFTPPPEGHCRRCGQLDKNGLCKLCLREIETGRYVWYVDLRHA